MKQEEFRLPDGVGTGYRFSTNDGTVMFYVVEPEPGVKANEVFIADVAIPAVRGLLRLLDGRKFTAADLLSRPAVDTLVAHQRRDYSDNCLCGALRPGDSHAEHVLDQLLGALMKATTS